MSAYPGLEIDDLGFSGLGPSQTISLADRRAAGHCRSVQSPCRFLHHPLG
ncbi:hypothetical protein [Nonomuraea basaltis]|nr:hypothetical protein [Nonomuraea basaltis]